ncbi:hypothetical protein H6F86_28810 [Phormidium sp. FACHB-592]|uniref:Uncharacterized protein n=1 Tax=Stenomitos frigidus AS-A4 TaxID=2933935 RepID=A0ABV0KD87_9CYAN|nr:hypothetical protein [Phormidium sp. FACHB-592]MBD2077820.1 hypothetical protein [Phormidium sp. FACHB-592]
MQERLSLFLKLTAFFVFQFWLMIVNHYSLRGSLLGLPATAVVGSSAIVLLAFLIVKVRQPISHPSVEISSRQNARLTLTFLIMGCLLTGFLLPMSEKEKVIFELLIIMLGICLWIYLFLISLVSLALLSVWGMISGFQIDSATGSAASTQITLIIGTLTGLIAYCVVIALFFDLVVSLVNRAALTKRLELTAYTLQAISLVLVLSFFLGKLQYTMPGDQLLCSKSYPSPSGQRSIVIEDYEELEGDRYYSHAYLNGLIFRRDLGDFPNRYRCRRDNLTFKWSEDESQVDWEKLYSSP